MRKVNAHLWHDVGLARRAGARVLVDKLPSGDVASASPLLDPVFGLLRLGCRLAVVAEEAPVAEAEAPVEAAPVEG